MPDVFSISKRSDVMSRIRGKGNKSTERTFEALLRSLRIKGWRRHFAITGRPDFAFPKVKLAIFLDGCFWHGCPAHCVFPKSNREFWSTKIQKNIERDRLVNRTLKKKGWRVMRAWEHELRKGSVHGLVLRLRRRLPDTPDFTD